MNIGEKIRELRTAKLMTQSELAGSQITRNMLSCIENGTANPSLQTILYIASRLNVPAGFLLAEEGDEIVYLFEVPCNSDATIILPDGQTFTAAPGVHTFRTNAND